MLNKPLKMKTTALKYFCRGLLIATCFFLATTALFAQQAKKAATADYHNLYSAGVANALLGGLYDAYYPYKQLKLHGNFGLGAPDKLDGEMIMLNGNIYHFKHTGKTALAGANEKTAYAVVCFFHADKVIKPGRSMNKAELFRYLDSVLNNQNGIYAIHISGNFRKVKTRAFPPVHNKPYPSMASLLHTQRFFEFNNINGDLVGYKLPAFMEGTYISGYHFHFLSDKKDSGGHMTDVVINNVTIEIDPLTSYTTELPQTDAFKHYDFTKDRTKEIESVENGKK